jgi:hypothetical protein
MSAEPIQARKLTPGEDTHLILLGVPYGFNFLRGKDFQDMLAFGRAVWAAALEAAPVAAQEKAPPREAGAALGKAIAAEMHARTMQSTDTNVTEPFKQWLDSVYADGRQGVAANEAWNAGVAFGREDGAAAQVPVEIHAALRAAGLMLIRTERGLQVAPGLEGVAESAGAAAPDEGEAADTRRLDWLETKRVNVREPFETKNGKLLFYALPGLFDDRKPGASSIRADIDFAMSASPSKEGS